MQPWFSWAVVLVAASACYLYYKQQSKPKYLEQRKPSTAEPTPNKSVKRRGAKIDESRPEADAAKPTSSSNEDSPKAPVVDGTTEGSKKRKAGKTAFEPLQQKPVPKSVSRDSNVGVEDDDDQEWTRQLADMKKGVSLKPSLRPEERSGTKKQSLTNGTSNFSTTSSSTSADTGAEADDDSSRALSPALTATKSNAAATGVDVSDMLETPAAGPAVLRIGDPTQPPREKKLQKPSAFQVQETKKQRQNRKKVEDKRAQREAEEKERRILLEKQKRTAREARGEPAKNGNTVAQTPTTSPWAMQNPPARGPAATSDAAAVPAVNDVPMLDTFEQDSASTASSSNAATARTATTSPSASWERQLPSEEEQMRMINKLNKEGEWNTVSGGRKHKKKHVINEETVSTPKAEDAPPQMVPRVTGHISTQTSEPWAVGGHPNDSDWAVV